MRPRWLAIFAAFCALLTLGCATTEAAPELLQVLDVVPREADVGDRIELLGSGFPEGRPAKVVFEGTLFRPGRKPVKGFELAVDATSTSHQRIELTVTEGVRYAFCGQGDRAIHTTFEGNLLVSFPFVAKGALPITGSLRNVRLDFQPPAQRRAISESREIEGERALAAMGLTVAEDAPASGGLLVTEVRKGGPADRANLAPGDLIKSFDGVRVYERKDLVPSGLSRTASVGFVRGVTTTAGARAQGREIVRSVSVEEFKPSAPMDLLLSGLLLLLVAASVFLFLPPFGSALRWLEHQLAFRMRARPQKPHRSRSLLGLLRSFRALLGEDVLSTDAETRLARLAPALVFLGLGALFLVMPFGQHIVSADLDIFVLFVLAATLLVTMGLLTEGLTEDRRLSIRGSVRTSGQLVSIEIPGAIAIVCVALMTGSLRAKDIVLAQGGLPWEWFVFRSPIAFALFVLWLSTCLFESQPRPAPFLERDHAPEVTRPSELRQLFYFFAEWGNAYVMCGLASVLFLGGWQLPTVPPLVQESSFWLQSLGAAWFLLKSWVLVFAVVFARRALPRVRMGQMLRICWKWLVPLTSAAFVMTALWTLWSPPEALEILISLGTFALWLLGAGYLALRLRRGLRAPGGQAQLNPLL